jgi:hypothetical protein
MPYKGMWQGLKCSMDIHVSYLTFPDRNVSNKTTGIRNTCKKERNGERKEDIYEEDRTV